MQAHATAHLLTRVDVHLMYDNDDGGVVDIELSQTFFPSCKRAGFLVDR